MATETQPLIVSDAGSDTSAERTPQVVELTQAQVKQTIVVVGSGPAGVRFAHEQLKRQANTQLLLFGDEPYQPYNRVQLSALLAGEVEHEQLLTKLPQQIQHPNFEFISNRIARVDTENKTVYDTSGQAYNYDKLVIATGSLPHRPNISGVMLTGVYTFRNLKDTETLYGRIARARHIVIVGGGLLGIEAARALQRANTKITIIQQGPRLMNRQLDNTAAAFLKSKVEKLGIEVIENSGVRKILGDTRVEGVMTFTQQVVPCDTVLLCAGIKPNVELARQAGLKIAKGVVVDDQLQSSEPDIYAIGECCEHRGKTYGLVNPGYEQAAVLANVLHTGNAHYIGSLEVSRLKVLGETVCSMGDVADVKARPFLREWRYHHSEKGIYRKLVTYHGKLIGAVGFGDWPEIHRIQEAYQNQRPIRIWEGLRFLLTGEVWGDSAQQDVALWPAETVICQCNNITQGTLVEAVAQGACSVKALSETTTAGTVCGSCKPLLESLTGNTAAREKEPNHLLIAGLSLLALFIAAGIFFIPGIPTSDTVQSLAPLESIWNDKFWKQVTGFSILGMTAVGLLMSLRKRFKNEVFGAYRHWRMAHIFLGFACVAALILHTGLHLGANLNRLLIIDFLSVITVGALAAITLSFSHRFSAHGALKLKKFWTWAHIFLVWPLPILLALHIFTVYYY